MLQDLNFDGLQDIRIFAPLTISHSRQFSLVFLRTKSRKFVRSLELERLDGFEVDERKQVIRRSRLTSHLKRSRGFGREGS